MMVGRRHSKRIDALESFAAPKAELIKQSVCSWAFVAKSLKILGLISFMYVFSITLTFYNKKYISKFKFPLSITMTHLVIKFMMSATLRWMLSVCRGEDRVMLEWKPYTMRIAPPGFASALDIALSNWSFEFITISLYTMTKSTVIVFILFFALILRLEKLRPSIVIVVLFIAAGLFLFTFKSTEFNLEGFLMVLGASFLSGLRWTLSQLVLQKAEIGLTNPLDMMYHMQPWMMVVLLPLAAGFEGLKLANSPFFFAYTSIYAVTKNCLILLAGAIIAFFLEFSEFMLLKHTSSLTLSISGIVKEIATLYLAVQINGDEMSTVNMFGMLLCLCGITVHVIMKAVNAKQEESSHQSEELEDSVELLRNGKPNSGRLIEDSEDEEEVFSAPRVNGKRQ